MCGCCRLSAEQMMKQAGIIAAEAGLRGGGEGKITGAGSKKYLRRVQMSTATQIPASADTGANLSFGNPAAVSIMGPELCVNRMSHSVVAFSRETLRWKVVSLTSGPSSRTS